jgi:hypothetical protein
MKYLIALVSALMMIVALHYLSSLPAEKTEEIEQYSGPVGQ